jgi:L,D-transpeptidase catalytic domain
MWLRSAVVAAAGLTALSNGGATAADPNGPLTLSNERTVTRLAPPLDIARVLKAPDHRSEAIGSLHFFTEDGYPESYLVLRRTFDSGGDEWVQVRLPTRPLGTTGWVPRDSLGAYRKVVTQLVINRHTLRATLYKNGRVVFRAPVGVGKPSTPTPSGHFWIRERLPNGHGNPLYGPLAFGTSAYTKLSDWPLGHGMIGIHGTNQPQLVPGRPSHGCIRMHNDSILRLKRLMPLGTPVRIF